MIVGNVGTPESALVVSSNVAQGAEGMSPSTGQFGGSIEELAIFQG